MNNQITGHTRLTGLLGSPVSHSISPLMHNEAFHLLGLDYAYLCFDVNEKKLPEAVAGMRALNARGWNCTMPDKTLMCELVDQLSPAARMIGAVNTVVQEEGCLTGYNTDGTGYMQAVAEEGLNPAGNEMTLLGAGGAATAIAVQAALDGVSSLHLFSRKGRSWAHAQKLVDTLNHETSCHTNLYDLEDTRNLKKCIEVSCLLTNGTSAGMAPNTSASLLPDAQILHSGIAVSDIIYNPRETRLMQLAKEAGCHTFNGLNMLLYQGAEAFRLWTGKEMPISLIKQKYFI